MSDELLFFFSCNGHGTNGLIDRVNKLLLEYLIDWTHGGSRQADFPLLGQRAEELVKRRLFANSDEGAELAALCERAQP